MLTINLSLTLYFTAGVVAVGIYFFLIYY